VDLKQRIEYFVPWPFEIRKDLKDENKLQGRLPWPEFRKGMIVSSWLTARGLILKQKLTYQITGSCKQVNIDNMLPEGLFGGSVGRREILGVGLELKFWCCTVASSLPSDSSGGGSEYWRARPRRQGQV